MASTEVVGGCLSQFHDDENHFELLLAFSDGREIGFSVSRNVAQTIGAEMVRETTEDAVEASAKSLSELIDQEKKRVEAMSRDEIEAMLLAQRESFVRGMTTPCEHGVLDFEQCSECRQASRQPLVSVSNTCATEGCCNPAARRFEAGGVGSDYCGECASKVDALAKPPETDTLVTLADCPIGLFRCGGELCLKTEYGSNEGRIDAYIVSSGEFFWGGTNTPAAQRKVMVEPVSEIAVSPAPVQHLRVTDLHVEAAKLALVKHSVLMPTDAAIRDMLAAAASLNVPPATTEGSDNG